MNIEKVVFGFFIILSLTLNVAFVVGEIENPNHHHPWELFAVILVNLIAMGLKLGDRSQIGALLLACGLVANLQLIAAAILWTVAAHVSETGSVAAAMASIVSLAAGALLANLVAVIMLVGDTLMSGR
jgi:hypothetical protein